MKIAIRTAFAPVLVLLAVALCEAAPRELVGQYVAEEQSLHGKQGGDDAVIEVSVWKVDQQQRLLVCKIIKQRGVIVSIMPTPIQTDAIRPIGNFVTVGNGWTPSTAFYLDERGRLYRTREDAKKHEKEITSEMLTALIKTTAGSKLSNVYLTVEQNTRYDRFEEVFRLLAPASEEIGVGWQQGWW
jgi:hypothetical protein